MLLLELQPDKEARDVVTAEVMRTSTRLSLEAGTIPGPDGSAADDYVPPWFTPGDDEVVLGTGAAAELAGLQGFRAGG